ncbi:MAG: hypothetical protein IKR68_03770 [Lachnospiraceae bacterium]|nr:hypothetical protein [Lachnospiraceae bacterium]
MRIRPIIAAGAIICLTLTGCTGAKPAGNTPQTGEAVQDQGTKPEETPAQSEKAEPEKEEAKPEKAEETAPAAKSATTESCDLFSITLPEDMAGVYVVETDSNRISVFEKEAKDAGFGGFAFGVAAYKEPSEYYGGMDRKVGEFTASDGTLYDIVIDYPSDVQFDYEKYAEEVPVNYDRLYQGAEDAVKTLAGADGKGSFVWGGGTKGEDLYQDVLEKFRTAIKEGWDANRLEAEDMSSMYYVISSSGEGNGADKIGYAYYDTNNDGIDELLVGEIAEDDWKGTVYDIYTMADRKPMHVVSGWDRNRYYALEDGFIVNEYSGGADESGWNVFDIEPNTGRIMDQVDFKIDGYENKDKPWFISYDEGETWENVTEEEFEERMETFKNYKRFDFTPLSK